jgi:hypothetical protein
MRSSQWMRSSLVVRASDCQFRSRNSPGFDSSIFRHSGICGAADEAVLNTVPYIEEKKSYFCCIFFLQFLVIETLDPDPDQNESGSTALIFRLPVSERWRGMWCSVIWVRGFPSGLGLSMVPSALGNQLSHKEILSVCLTVKSSVATVKSCVATVKSCVATVKSCVATVKSVFATVKSCVATVKSCVATVKSCVKVVLLQLTDVLLHI